MSLLKKFFAARFFMTFRVGTTSSLPAVQAAFQHLLNTWRTDRTETARKLTLHHD